MSAYDVENPMKIRVRTLHLYRTWTFDDEI